MNNSVYIPRTLTSTKKDGSVETILDSSLVGLNGPAVLLGEPGIGKTELLKQLHEENQGFRFVHAGSLIRKPKAYSSVSEVLFIDGLDEVVIPPKIRRGHT